MNHIHRLLSTHLQRSALPLLCFLVVQTLCVPAPWAKDSKARSLGIVSSSKSAPLFQYSLSHTEHGTELLLESQGSVGLKQNHSFYLRSPRRFILDIPYPGAPQGYEAISVQREELTGIRIACHPDKVRFVFSLPEDPEVKCNVTSDDSSLRVFIGKSLPPKKGPALGAVMGVNEELQPSHVAEIGRDLESPGGASGDRSPSSGAHISCSFVKADLSEFFTLLSQVSGKKIELSPDVTGQITMRLDGVPWNQALEIVSKLYRLKVTEREGSLFIAPSGKN